MFRFTPRGPSATTPLPASRDERSEAVAEEASDWEELQDEEEYQAFSAVADTQHVEALWLRGMGGQEHVMLDYGWRRMVRYDGLGCALTLVFADCTARILGRNLDMLIKKLQNRKVEWVQTYDPARWPEPAPQESIVTAIVLEFASEAKEEQAPRLRLVEKGE